MSDSTPEPRAPRIAIKFGAPSSAGSKPSSQVTNKRGQSQPSSALGKRQRPSALHHDSESGEDDDHLGRHEAVTVFGADTAASTSGGVSASKRRNKEYIISSQRNRDWKADVKTKKAGRAAATRDPPVNNQNLETAPADQDKDVRWGLNVSKKPTREAQENISSPDDMSKEQKKEASDMAISSSHPSLDADKDAMDALLGNRKPTEQFIIEDTSVSSKPQFSEKDAYQRGLHEAAEVSTIEEYSEIPEGEFGAAMLRGMGWKGEEFGSKPKEVKRRPHLMGLGSKEDEEIKKAELAKRQGYRERRPRLDEYRRDREKDKQERSGRYRDSYKSERERERREQSYDHRHRDRYRERDNRDHRG
ncbi:DExH-box splicing factor binding site-domain-containing protein [Nemania abortiva]|nr:DExH-box splicing factor binding site-domain-containing protein [Nemania abortiva]